MDVQAVFGQLLRRDPSIALPDPPPFKAEAIGPEHKVQFVVELVGPRSLASANASTLLDAQWSSALGNPEIFGMAPADRDWQPLRRSDQGSLDSLALCWDLISEQGELTSQAAAHLFHVAESFGAQVQRRAMPLPPPADVNRAVSVLREIRDGLDIGVEILMVPKGPDFCERDVWIALSSLGFDLAPSGFFEMSAPGANGPLVTITPSGGQDAFKMSSVETGVSHPGLIIGFSVPLSADPVYSLEGSLKTADYLCKTLDAMAFNDADQALGPTVKNELSANLLAAVRALMGAGIEPGSRAAQKLFG